MKVAEDERWHAADGTEVTQMQYQAFLANNPTTHADCGVHRPDLHAAAGGCNG
jgi:hypothetical protein